MKLVRIRLSQSLSKPPPHWHRHSISQKIPPSRALHIHFNGVSRANGPCRGCPRDGQRVTGGSPVHRQALQSLTVFNSEHSSAPIRKEQKETVIAGGERGYHIFTRGTHCVAQIDAKRDFIILPFTPLCQFSGMA